MRALSGRITAPIQFDPTKDEANRAAHGMSLAFAELMDIRATVPDTRRDYGEARFVAFGTIEGVRCALVYTVRNDHVRPISLRRAHAKEYDRHVR